MLAIFESLEDVNESTKVMESWREENNFVGVLDTITLEGEVPFNLPKITTSGD